MPQNHTIHWRLFALAILIALLVRGGFLWKRGASLADDPDAYRQIAVEWSETGVFGLDGTPTAYRPPLYPAMLRTFGTTPRAVTILHLIAGLVTVAGTYLLCIHTGLGRWSFVAAMLVTFDPILLNQSTQVMTETVATMLVVLSLLGMAHLMNHPTLGWAALTGVLFGLAGLCRPELLAWAGLCVVTLPFLLEKHEGTSPATNCNQPSTSHARWLTTVALLFLTLTLTPWMIRNYHVFGRPSPTTTHGGYTLLLANNDSFYDYLRTGEWGSTWDADKLGPKWAGHAKFSSPAEELQKDREAYREAWSDIRKQPGMFLYSCLVRAGRLWSLAPHQGPHYSPQAVRYLIGAWYLTIYILSTVGLVAIWRKSTSLTAPARATWLGGGMLAISTTAVHSIFWSNMRMRAPLIPLLAMAAATGLAHWASKKRSESPQPSNSSSTDEV